MDFPAHVDAALLVVRLFFGVGLFAHGFNKLWGEGGLAGTAGWFESIGMRAPRLQALAAASTEMGAGLLLAAGLITPLAAAGIIGVMVVAGWVVHRANGFFIVDGGWEFTAAFAVTAWAVGAIGPGRYSLDRAFDIGFRGATGAVLAAAIGIGAGIGQLLAFYRPADTSPQAEQQGAGSQA